MIKVGIIGCGVIGSELARRIDTEINKALLVAVSDNIYENPPSIQVKSISIGQGEVTSYYVKLEKYVYRSPEG